MDLEQKIEVLVNGAKYDVSCSSSGSDTAAVKGKLGDCSIGGICHSFTADGRCISLLKILMSNDCQYDCKYCGCRRSNEITRASISPRELCELVTGFYKRNYIEGLFLSSAVYISPDHTMQMLLETVMLLRTEYGFRGYIHLKAIPNADKDLISAAAQYADRMSVNIELPNFDSLKLLAPSKTREGILGPIRMLSGAAKMQTKLLDAPERQRTAYLAENRRIIPAGQTTQMIIGATPDTDGAILRLSEALYRSVNMKRVYYSAYIPINKDNGLTLAPPNLVRENRLYQADWLLRFYGFKADEIVGGGNLSLDVDPKCHWALRNLHLFPVEINSAPHETLMRVPGIGARLAWRIMKARRNGALTYDDLVKMRCVLKRAKHFITVGGRYYGAGIDSGLYRVMSTLSHNDGFGREQLTMFGGGLTEQLALSGGENERSLIIGEF